MSQRGETFTVEQSLPDERLDKYLCARYPMVSRGAIQRLIQAGHIRVNDGAVKPTQVPRKGDVISVYWPEARPPCTPAEAIPLDILYEDDQLLVLNKPSGLVVHPGAGHEEHTLVNALLHHCAGALSGIGGVARPGIVHRLDQETSGCMVVAKSDAAHLALAKQFTQRTVRKVYHALVCGVMPRDGGEIHAAITRHSNHRKRMVVSDERGREAWTSYRVLERLPRVTLVEAVIHTGRTHQVRVHFQYLGFPLAGDLIYGKRPNKLLAEVTGYTAPRVMLHACYLEFTHPASGERAAFESGWPPDFQAARQAYAALDSGSRKVDCG